MRLAGRHRSSAKPGTIFREKRASVSAQREVRITNKLGLHARPASQFVKCARSFRSEIWLVKDGTRYSVASLIDVLRANLDCGATATLEAYGADAEDAINRLEKLLGEFHEHEDP
jgi:phosphocarrier protein HPr